jgi:hypothetical protein
MAFASRELRGASRFNLDSPVWIGVTKHGPSLPGRVPLDYRSLPQTSAETSRIDQKAVRTRLQNTAKRPRRGRSSAPSGE